MTGKNKFFALVLSAVMALGVCAAAGCGGTQDNGGKPDDGPGNQSTVTPEVKSVALNYSNAAVEGLLSMNLTKGTFELIPVVTADEGASYTLTWTSSEHDVATVEGNNTKATVTLNGAGETVIKADTGKKSAEFILSVEDDRPKTQYTITVVDGVAKNADGETITKAEAGTQVTLEATTPAHKTFTEWTFDNDDVALNGLTFTMPEGNVTATANFTDTLYPLTLVGATVTKAGEVSNPQGTAGGYASDEFENNETKITNYNFKFGTQITIKATPESGRAFVGWDYRYLNNRVGEMGIDEYTFTMGDEEETSYTAVYSSFSTSVWTADNANSKGCTTTKITDGNGDADLQGLSGYTVTIPASQTAWQGYGEENIKGSNLRTPNSRGMGKVIFKNHSDTQTLKLEVFASYCLMASTSGVIEVAPNAVVVKYFPINIGLGSPWMGWALRENNGSEEVKIDMVFGVASELYPNGDPQVMAAEGSEPVDISYRATGATWQNPSESYGPEYTVLGDQGVFIFGSYATKWSDDPSARHMVLNINNLPDYDAENPTLTIYGNCINRVNAYEEPKQYLEVIISTDPEDPTAGQVAKAELNIKEIGEVIPFVLTFEREENEYYYIFVRVAQFDAKDSSHAIGVILQFAYTNAFGYEEV